MSQEGDKVLLKQLLSNKPSEFVDWLPRKEFFIDVVAKGAFLNQLVNGFAYESCLTADCTCSCGLARALDGDIVADDSLEGSPEVRRAVPWCYAVVSSIVYVWVRMREER